MNNSGSRVPLDLEQQLSCYWVAPGTLLAGAHPALAGAASLLQAIRGLIRQDIDQFLDLTVRGESTEYESVLASEVETAGRLLEYFRFSLTDMSVPSTRMMTEVLDCIEAAHRLERNVYVHCLAGLGRTGTVVGCFLVRGGLTGDEALQRLDGLRRAVSSPFSPSPYTDDQRRFVRDWRG